MKTKRSPRAVPAWRGRRGRQALGAALISALVALAVWARAGATPVLVLTDYDMTVARTDGVWASEWMQQLASALTAAFEDRLEVVRAGPPSRAGTAACLELTGAVAVDTVARRWTVASRLIRSADQTVIWTRRDQVDPLAPLPGALPGIVEGVRDALRDCG